MEHLLNPTFLLSLLWNGLVFASLYALVAVGLTLIFGVLEIVNFAHGSFYMLGGLIMFVLLDTFKFPYFIAIIGSTVLIFIGGLLAEKVAIEPVRERSWKIPLVSTLALNIVIVNATLLFWGGRPKVASTGLIRKFVKIGPIITNQQRLLLIVTAILAFVALFVLLKKTRMGKALRALPQNREAAIVIGIRPERIYLLAFAISASLAGLAGAVAAPLYIISPIVGMPILLKSFACVVLGGFGKILGAVIGALIIGVLEGITGGFFHQYIVDISTFLIIVLVLLIRPEGIFGRRIGI